MQISDEMVRVALDACFRADVSMEEGMRAVLARFAQSVRSAAFEDAARVCGNWVGTFGHVDIKYTPAREYAVDAIEDIAEILRSPEEREKLLASLAPPATAGKEG